MTAPALPGAAPDPARLPPEVERAIDAAANAAHDAGNAYGSDYWSSSEREFARITSENATAALRTAIRAALDKRGEVSAASAASARALGGDGEPVAWGVVRDGRPGLICVSMTSKPILLDGSERVVPLYTRPAATGDTGEGGARG